MTMRNDVALVIVIVVVVVTVTVTIDCSSYIPDEDVRYDASD